ncbi:hypothetical protein T06_6758, partial [Trichinella sp. T6]
LFAHRRDVLACSRKAARRDPYSTLIVYEYNKKVTMISYAPRKNSNVLLLTPCHAKLKVNNQQGFKRPDIITYYNLGNGGLDSLDARIEDFCCKKDQQIHHADVVCINNAFLLMRHKQSYQKTKKRFMRELLAGQTHRNEVSKSKIYAQTKHAFIGYGVP